MRSLKKPCPVKLLAGKNWGGRLLDPNTTLSTSPQLVDCNLPIWTIDSGTVSTVQVDFDKPTNAGQVVRCWMLAISKYQHLDIDRLWVPYGPAGYSPLFSTVNQLAHIQCEWDAAEDHIILGVAHTHVYSSCELTAFTMPRQLPVFSIAFPGQSDC